MALLTKLGFIKSTIDSSLWFRDGLILVFYVDNGIIISLNNVMILHFIEELREECKLDLGIKADYAGYLGVDLIKLPDGSMLMSQTGLIERGILTISASRTRHHQRSLRQQISLVHSRRDLPLKRLSTIGPCSGKSSMCRPTHVVRLPLLIINVRGSPLTQDPRMESL
jgi:hypothetical protein